jgi:hypothetical protein
MTQPQMGISIELQTDLNTMPGEVSSAAFHPIDLTAWAPHTPEFGTWRRLTDGSDIRYRAKWPGKP